MTAPEYDKPRAEARSFAAAARNFQDAAEQLAAASVEEARRAAAFSMPSPIDLRPSTFFATLLLSCIIMYNNSNKGE